MSQRALVDTNILYAAFHEPDQYHDEGIEVVRAADHGEVPTLVVLDFVLAETMNPLTQDLGHQDAMNALGMLQESMGFVHERTPNSVWARTFDVHNNEAHLSFVDALLVAYAREHSLSYLYSFDKGFDSVGDIQRLTTPDNPYEA